MGENNCSLHGEIELRLGSAEKDIENIDGRVDVLEKTTALDNQKFTMLLENLSKLPDAINDIKDTMLLMQNEIKETNRKTDDMKTQIQKLNDKVCAIDSESMFNLRIWLKQNFISIILAVTGVSAWVTYFIK